MTAITSQAGMFTFQHIASLLVVKRFRVPLDQREIFPIVFGVTAHALLAGARRDVISRMQPFACGKAAGDLSVAFQALKGSLASQFVTGGAVGGPG